MLGLTCVVAFLLACGVLAYQRASLIIWTISLALLLILTAQFDGLSTGVIITGVLFFVVFTLLNIKSLRRRYLSQPLFTFYKKIMPVMSRTEREAISAGTVTWEGDLFRGNPNWDKLLAMKAPTLTAEEKAFIDGPVETVCNMTNDWEITHQLLDLPPNIWSFLKDNGFFGLIIPKQYGGKQFSAFAHSQILTKLSGISVTLSTTVAVPNSLGPAELLLHYGTEAQKNYYLPRLARGEDIPCFALTSPTAGSDAGSMTDHGVVCKRDWNGKETLGILLNFDKRYITLAPVATVIGLAFKLYDPNHLLGTKEDIGITCALIPRNTPGMSIGRRHFPVNTPFQNGPVHGKDMFIPMDYVIGGAEEVGKGWRMLMECLAAGRAISLPASVLGGSKLLCYAGGAYARVRRQFNMPIGRFEGIEEPLGRIGANTYAMDATRLLAVSYIDQGEKPAVASAIVKCHVTEMGRELVLDGMDMYGGKGICLGPKNLIGRSYESAPIAITVEGANILTRNMIIYGQGALRCHPYVLPELEAARMTDPTKGLAAFDNAVVKHMAFGISNMVRSFVLAMTSSHIVKAPQGKTKRYFQHATRFASALGLISDVSMLVLGGSLKRKESISARLGDILSDLYILSAVLKHYQDEGKQKDDLPIVHRAAIECLYRIQEAFNDIINNFPSRTFRYVLRALIFPFGRHFAKPKFKLNHKIAQLLTMPSETRARLSAGAYLSLSKVTPISEAQDALIKAIAAEPIEKTIRAAQKDGAISGYNLAELAQCALSKNILTIPQFDIFMQSLEATQKIIAVDDFSNEELAGNQPKSAVVTKLHEDKASTG